MAYKDPNRKLTVKDYVRLFVVLALFGAFVIFVLKLAGTPKPVATYTQVWDVLVAHRYTPVDLTEEYIKDDPSLKNALLQNITANQDGFLYYISLCFLKRCFSYIHIFYEPIFGVSCPKLIIVCLTALYASRGASVLRTAISIGQLPVF